MAHRQVLHIDHRLLSAYFSVDFSFDLLILVRIEGLARVFLLFLLSPIAGLICWGVRLFPSLRPRPLFDYLLFGRNLFSQLFQYSVLAEERFPGDVLAEAFI